MLPFEIVQNRVKNHAAIEPSLSVQKFYNGRCSEITVENSQNIDEVLEFLNFAATSEKIKISRD